MVGHSPIGTAAASCTDPSGNLMPPDFDSITPSAEIPGWAAAGCTAAIPDHSISVSTVVLTKIADSPLAGMAILDYSTLGIGPALTSR